MRALSDRLVEARTASGDSRPPGRNFRFLRGRAVLDTVPPGEYQIAGVCSGDGSFLHDPDAPDWLAEKAEKIRVGRGEQKTVTVKDVPLP